VVLNIQGWLTLPFLLVLRLSFVELGPKYSLIENAHTTLAWLPASYVEKSEGQLEIKSKSQCGGMSKSWLCARARSTVPSAFHCRKTGKCDTSFLYSKLLDVWRAIVRCMN
jgi:hypothetical protein